MEFEGKYMAAAGPLRKFNGTKGAGKGARSDELIGICVSVGHHHARARAFSFAAAEKHPLFEGRPLARYHTEQSAGRPAGRPACNPVKIYLRFREVRC